MLRKRRIAFRGARMVEIMRPEPERRQPAIEDFDTIRARLLQLQHEAIDDEIGVLSVPNELLQEPPA